VLIHSNFSGRRNHVLAVAILHQARAPSPRVGVQSKSAGSSECVRSYRVSMRTEELASCRCILYNPTKRTAAKPSSTYFTWKLWYISDSIVRLFFGYCRQAQVSRARSSSSANASTEDHLIASASSSVAWYTTKTNELTLQLLLRFAR